MKLGISAAALARKLLADEILRDIGEGTSPLALLGKLLPLDLFLRINPAGEKFKPRSRLISRLLQGEFAVTAKGAAGRVRRTGIAHVQHERLGAGVGDANAKPGHHPVP